MNATFFHHWRKISKESEFSGGSLSGEIIADFGIVGGGLTGLHAGLEFARNGDSVVILEASLVGQAASGRSNGQIIPQHSKQSPGEIVAQFGHKRGDLYNQMVASAPADLFDLIDKHAIRCDAVSNGWIQACHSPHALERARIFHREWKALGADVEWLDAADIKAKIGGGDFLGGWKARRAGYLNPYALTQGMARVAAEQGARIFQDSPVVAIEKAGDRWRLGTSGGSVLARKVLVASNVVTDKVWPALRKAMIPVRVYQIATQPLDARLSGRLLPGREGVSDTGRDIRAFRYDSEGRICMVGVHTLWHDAAERGKANVMRRLRDMIPAVPDRPAAEYWEGTIAVVPDKTPRFMELAPGVLFAGIYSGRGMAISAAWGRTAAQFLGERIGEGDLPVPLTRLQTVAGHAVGVLVARYIHPWHRVLDWRDKAAAKRSDPK